MRVWGLETCEDSEKVSEEQRPTLLGDSTDAHRFEPAIFPRSTVSFLLPY